MNLSLNRGTPAVALGIAGLLLAAPTASAKCYSAGVHFHHKSRLKQRANEQLPFLVNRTGSPQSYSFTTKVSRTVKWTKSKELSASAGFSFAGISSEIQGTYGESIERSRTSETSKTINVTAKPHTAVSASYGVFVRTYTGYIYEYISPGTDVHDPGCPNKPTKKVKVTAPVGEGWKVYRVKK